MAKSQSQRGTRARTRRRRADVPRAEAARLAALRRIKVLDTPPEEAFDGIVRLAARVCAAPIALISLVDAHRQWFKARVGLEALETPRALAFCAHAIGRPDEIMVVTDASRDRRFRNNPLVTGAPGIRFYAGAPLVTREGAALGTLCVIDRKPRELRPEQLEALAALARQAATEMELRADRDEFASRYRQALITAASDHAESEAANRLAEQRLRAAIEHLDESVVLTDAQDRIVLVNQRFRQDHADVADHLRPGRRYEDFLRARVAAGDAVEAASDAEAWIAARLTRRRNPAGTEERQLRDGTWIQLRDQRLPDGGTITMRLDITERKRAEQALAEGEARFRDFAAAAADSFWETDADLRITWVSEAASGVLGVPADWVLGKTLDDLLPRGVDLTQEPYRTSLEKRRRRAPFRDSRYPVDLPSGRRWISSSAVPRFDAAGNFLGYRGATSDITERVRAEETLRAREQMLGSLLRNMPGDVYRCRNDRDWTMEYVSEGVLELTGYPPSAFTERRVTYGSLVHPEDRDRIWREAQAALAERRPYMLEYRIRDALGGEKWVWERGLGDYAEDGSVLALDGFVADITARKRAEQALAASETRLRAIIDSEPECVKVLDAEGRLEEMNAAGLRMVEADSAEALLGQCVYGLIAPEYREAFRDAIERVCRGESDANLEFQIVGLKGTRRWLEMHAVPLRDSASGRTRSLSVTRDITDRKRAEAALREREHELTLIMDGVPDMIARADRKQRILFANRAFAELMERSASEIVGRSVQEIVSAEAYAQLKPYIERVLSGKPVTYERTQVQSDGRTIAVEGRYIPDIDEHGKVVGWFALMRDITEERRAREALARSEARFRSLTRLSSDWYWEQDEQFRQSFLSDDYDALAGAPRAVTLGTRRWERPNVTPLSCSWEEHRATLDAHLPFKDFEYLRIAEDGRRVFVSLSGEPVFDESGTFKGYRGTGRNITDRTRSEQLLRLEHQVTRALAEADDAAAGVKAVLRAVCETEGWGCGRFFKLDPAAGMLRFHDGWCLPQPAYQQFLAQSAPLVFRPGEGLAGIVWQTREPVWSADTSRDSRVLGKKLAQNSSIRAAFAIPVHAENDVLGVLSFSGQEAREPDQRVLQAARVIGSQVGQFLQRKRAEEEVRSSRHMLENVIDAIPMSIFAKDTSSNYVMVNKYFVDFFKTSKQAVLNLHTSRLPTHDATRKQSLEDDQRVFQNRRTFTHETTVQRPDGTPVPFHSSKIPLFDDAGKLVGLLGINRDITEERRSQEVLRESEERFRAVFERSNAGVSIWGEDERYIAVNPAFCRFLGYAAEELVGKSRRELLLQEDREGIEGVARLKAGQIGHIERERPFRRRDGGITWGHTTTIAVRGAAGAPAYYVSVITDVNETRHARERLERMNVELEERVSERTAELREAVKELDAFTYSVSHDLRAPVGAVSGFAHLLRTKESERLSEDGKHLLGVIEQNAERMINLIEGLLRFARLGSSELRRVRQSMNELAGEALLDFAGAAARAEVSIGELPECDGDRMLLGQVWANLIGNAFKYSRNHAAPRIEIGWDASKSAYFVRDNGIGFNMAYAEKLFGVFERLHHELEFEGSGIGLAIADRIVKRHGGTIWANSADGAGATFWFTVPAPQAPGTRSSPGNGRPAGAVEKMHGPEAFSPDASAAPGSFTDNA